MFYGCKNLKKLTLGTFDTSNVTSYSSFWDTEYLPDGRPWIELFESPTQSESATTETTSSDVIDVIFEITHSDITLTEIGQSYTLEVVSDLNNLKITWTSQDESVATVNESGTIICTGSGATKIIGRLVIGTLFFEKECIVRCNLD